MTRPPHPDQLSFAFMDPAWPAVVTLNEINSDPIIIPVKKKPRVPSTDWKYPRNRKCASCDRTFLAETKFNRICRKCKRNVDWRDGDSDYSVTR